MYTKINQSFWNTFTYAFLIRAYLNLIKADFRANSWVENGDNVHSGNLQQYNFQTAWKQATLLYTFHGKAIKYIQMKLTVNLRQIPRYLFTKKPYSLCLLSLFIGYDGSDSFYACTKTTSHRASVRQSQERWFRRDFCNGAKQRRSLKQRVTYRIDVQLTIAGSFRAARKTIW